MLIAALLVAAHFQDIRPESTYTSPALREMVARTAAANRLVPAALAGYEAFVESEVSLLVSGSSASDGAVAGTAAASTEAAAQVEQFQLKSTWNRNGAYTQRVVGYRGRQLGPMFSALSMFSQPWTAPTLYGDRLVVIFGGPPSLRGRDSTSPPVIAVHPFASDRGEYYRFTGGDTVASLRSGDHQIVVAQIHVEPRDDSPRVMVFSGEVFVDVVTGDIVRMRGRVHMALSANQSMRSSLVRTLSRLHEEAYIDFENSEHQGRFWLPRTQRLEYQVSSGLVEARAVIRVQSEWRDVTLRLRESDSTDTAVLSPPRPILESVPPDSFSMWTAWQHDLGLLSRGLSAHDFDDVAPAERRSSGRPSFQWQARHFSDFIRYNRVEGLYTGAPARLDFRDAAPGYSLRGQAGWAWYQRDVKWDAEGVRVRGPWVVSLRGGRNIVSTNDFESSIGGSGGSLIGGLFGRDDNDWVDRESGVLGVTREVGAGHESSVRATVGFGHDMGFDREISRGVLRGTFTPNRPVLGGGYRRYRLDIDINRSVVASPLASGVGWSLSYENGSGNLSWERAEGRVAAQHTVGRFVLGLGAEGGVVRSPRMPPQQLFELGGSQSLPGFDYKAFAGDAAMVGRAFVQYDTRLLDSPLRYGRIVLPAIAPRLQVGVFGGRAWASAASAPVLTSLGWVDSNGWRSTLDVRLRFFAGAISVGAARVLDAGAHWRGVIGFGQGF